MSISLLKRAESENNALLSRIAQGDEAAFSKFYDQFADQLYSLVYKILNDAKETENVLQEGFMEIWRKAATHDSERASALTWAVMIMRNKAFDHIRSHRSRSRMIEEAKLEISYDSEEQEGESVAHTAQSAIFRAAVDRIPETQRQAIALAFFSGLTQLQIAEKLGESVETVKSRIGGGLLNLHKFLNASPLVILNSDPVKQAPHYHEPAAIAHAPVQLFGEGRN